MDSKNSGPALQKSMTRALFIESLIGNIKEKYFFEKKLGSGGYGAVYLAKNKGTGKEQSLEELGKLRRLGVWSGSWMAGLVMEGGGWVMGVEVDLKTTSNSLKDLNTRYLVLL